MDNLLYTLSVYTVIIPLVTGLVLWKFQEANARIMLVLIAFASCASIYPEFYPVNKPLLYNLYTILDVFCWSLMFYRSSRMRVFKYIILFLFLSYMAFYIWYVSGHEYISKKFYNGFVCLDSVLQVMCVLLFFYEKYESEKILNLEQEPMFWFCLAILLYAPSTYLRFALFYDKSYLNYLNIFHSIINILLYIMITVGFIVKFNMIKSVRQWIKLY